MARITIINNPTGSTTATVEAHGTGCRDIARKTRSPFSDAWEIGDFKTTREVWVDYNADFLDEGGAENAWPIKFFPCCGLTVDDDRTWDEN